MRTSLSVLLLIGMTPWSPTRLRLADGPIPFERSLPYVWDDWHGVSPGTKDFCNTGDDDNPDNPSDARNDRRFERQPPEIVILVPSSVQISVMPSSDNPKVENLIAVMENKVNLGNYGTTVPNTPQMFTVAPQQAGTGIRRLTVQHFHKTTPPLAHRQWIPGRVKLMTVRSHEIRVGADDITYKGNTGLLFPWTQKAEFCWDNDFNDVALTFTWSGPPAPAQPDPIPPPNPVGLDPDRRRVELMLTSGTGAMTAEIFVTNSRTGKVVRKSIDPYHTEWGCAVSLHLASAEAGLESELYGKTVKITNGQDHSFAARSGCLFDTRKFP